MPLAPSSLAARTTLGDGTWRIEGRKLLLALAAAAVLCLVALVYSPARRAPFLWDDHVLVEQVDTRASVRDLMTRPFFPETPLADAHPGYYRPVTTLSFRLDGLLDETPEGYHVTNVLLHILACALLLATAIRLGATGEAAVVAALVWGLLPRLSEAVAWVAGRTDVLACVCGLAAVATSPLVVARPARPPQSAYLLSIFSGSCLFAGLLGKEVALAFAAAIGALAVRERPRGAAVRPWFAHVVLGLLIPVLAYAALRASAVGARLPTGRELGSVTRLGAILEAVERYVEMSVDAFRPRTSIGLLGEVDPARAALGALLLGGAAALAVRLRRAERGVRLAITTSAVALAMVLHVVPVALSGSVAADRLLYVPLAGIALAGAIAARGLNPRPRIALGALACSIALPLAGSTKARAGDYTDEIRFWVVAAEQGHPRNTLPRRVLATAVTDAGDAQLGCRLYERAAAVLRDSPSPTVPAYRRTREKLASCRARVGRYDEAVELAEELAREFAHVGRIRMVLGFVRLHRLDFDAAAEALEASGRLDPALVPAVRDVLAELPALRRTADNFATKDAQAADPLRYARFLERVGRIVDAEEVYAAIARSRPGTPDAREAISFLARQGTIELAERVLADEAPSVGSDLSRKRLAARAARWRKVDALRERIERLT
jgi:tetratricopeptide (TPR) repeat protein